MNVDDLADKIEWAKQAATFQLSRHLFTENKVAAATIREYDPGETAGQTRTIPCLAEQLLAWQDRHPIPWPGTRHYEIPSGPLCVLLWQTPAISTRWEAYGRARPSWIGRFARFLFGESSWARWMTRGGGAE